MMSRDELKELVTRHLGLGFDYADIDGWKVTFDSDNINSLYCCGVTENIFSVYDLNILSYNKIYLIRLDFKELPFDTFIWSKLRDELNRLTQDKFRDSHNCIIIEIDNYKELDSTINLNNIFQYLDFNILYLRDTEYLSGWFNCCRFHVFLAPKLESLLIPSSYNNTFLSKDEELTYFVPNLKDCAVMHSTPYSEYRLVTKYNNQNLLSKYNYFGYPKELFIDKITDTCLKQISDYGFMLSDNITCCEIGNVHPSILESNFVKVDENAYNKEFNRLSKICDFIDNLK